MTLPKNQHQEIMTCTSITPSNTPENVSPATSDTECEIPNIVESKKAKRGGGDSFIKFNTGKTFSIINIDDTP